MAKASIPVYDICTINGQAQKDLLVERFGAYRMMMQWLPKPSLRQ